MAITATPYDAFLSGLITSEHNFNVDTINAALMTVSYIPDLSGHAVYRDVNDYEVSGTGYTTGGITLTDVAFSLSAPGELTIAATAPSWPALTAEFQYVLIYKNTGAGSTSALIGLVDLETPRTYTEEPLQLNFPDGAVKLTRG